MAKKAPKTKSEIRTIMFVDLTSYTELSSKLKRDAFDKMHDLFNKLCKPTFKEYSGHLVKKIGDAFLVTFKSPTDALHCATRLQEKFKQHNIENKSKNPLKIKVALHTGEVLLREKDVFGDAVNVVARLAGDTPSTNIYFTKAIFLAMNKNEIPFSFVGVKNFKGVGRPVHVSKVDWTTKQRSKRIGQGFGLAFSILAKLSIFAIIIFLIYLLFKSVA